MSFNNFVEEVSRLVAELDASSQFWASRPLAEKMQLAALYLLHGNTPSVSFVEAMNKQDAFVPGLDAKPVEKSNLDILGNEKPKRGRPKKT